MAQRKKEWHCPTPERRVYACNSEARTVERIVSPRGLQPSGEWRGGRNNPYQATASRNTEQSRKVLWPRVSVSPRGVGYARCSAVAHRRMRTTGVRRSPSPLVGITPPTMKTATPLSAFVRVIKRLKGEEYPDYRTFFPFYGIWSINQPSALAVFCVARFMVSRMLFISLRIDESSTRA